MDVQRLHSDDPPGHDRKGKRVKRFLEQNVQLLYHELLDDIALTPCNFSTGSSSSGYINS